MRKGEAGPLAVYRTSLCPPVFLCMWEGLLDPGLDSGDQLGSSPFLGAPEYLHVELFPWDTHSCHFDQGRPPMIPLVASGRRSLVAGGPVCVFGAGEVSVSTVP